MPPIEEDYICGHCQGEIIPIGVDEETGLKVYECGKCHRGRQFECPGCHKPRTIFIRGICIFCSGVNKIGKSFQKAINRNLN
jgi:hypothetical protein